MCGSETSHIRRSVMTEFQVQIPGLSRTFTKIPWLSKLGSQIFKFHDFPGPTGTLDWLCNKFSTNIYPSNHDYFQNSHELVNYLLYQSSKYVPTPVHLRLCPPSHIKTYFSRAELVSTWPRIAFLIMVFFPIITTKRRNMGHISDSIEQTELWRCHLINPNVYLHTFKCTNCTQR